MISVPVNVHVKSLLIIFHVKESFFNSNTKLELNTWYCHYLLRTFSCSLLDLITCRTLTILLCLFLIPEVTEAINKIPDREDLPHQCRREGGECQEEQIQRHTAM